MIGANTLLLESVWAWSPIADIMVAATHGRSDEEHEWLNTI